LEGRGEGLLGVRNMSSSSSSELKSPPDFTWGAAEGRTERGERRKEDRRMKKERATKRGECYHSSKRVK